MDWKDGLTAAVVVGLGYLGFRNVTKGAESFSADSKCDHSNFIGDVCEALSWAEYNCLDCGATQYHEFPLHYENVEALEIIDTDHKIRSDFYARLERDFPDPHDWEAESFEDMKAKWSKHNSCKQYQETGECPHEGCKSAESFSENEYVDGSFVPRGNRKEGFTFYCAACDTRLPLKLRNRSLKIAQEFGMGTGEICRPCVKGIKNLDYISLSAESFSADMTQEEINSRLPENICRCCYENMWTMDGYDFMCVNCEEQGTCENCSCEKCNVKLEDCKCDTKQCSVCGDLAVHVLKKGEIVLCDKHYQQQFGRYSERENYRDYPGKYSAESFSADDKKVKQALKRVGPLANEVRDIGKTLRDSLEAEESIVKETTIECCEGEGVNMRVTTYETPTGLEDVITASCRLCGERCW